MYWDINRPASYDCLFNFILGARGVGKSYGTKDAAIKDYIKTGAQFVYVRRFKSELREVKLKKFFEDIEDKYPDHEFKVNQGVIQWLKIKEKMHNKHQINSKTPYNSFKEIE